MTATLTWLSEADVVALVDLRAAIDAVEAGFAAEAAGSARNMAKTHASWDGGSTLHAIGAVLEHEGVVGTKTWAHTAAGATPLLLLFDAGTGALQAVVEAFALGNLRTAAVSAVATDRLAAEGARRLAVVGTGKQALPQVAAAAAVRTVEHVAVYSRNEARRAVFTARVRDELGLVAHATGSVEEAVEDADIVTLVTRATTPFLGARVPRPGTHVNAIGAIVPDRMEFEPALLDRCAVVAADSVEQARRLSRELAERFGDDEAQWRAVRPLAELVASGERRPPGADLTLFKALGVGIADLSLGVECVRRARGEGRGAALPHPTRAAPNLSPRPSEVADA